MCKGSPGKKINWKIPWDGRQAGRGPRWLSHLYLLGLNSLSCEWVVKKVKQSDQSTHSPRGNAWSWQGAPGGAELVQQSQWDLSCGRLLESKAPRRHCAGAQIPQDGTAVSTSLF